MKAIIRVVAANLVWGCQQGKGGHWIAFCDPLRLTVQADTWSDLMEDVGITLDAMMRDLLENGELERFLRDHKWTLVGSPMPSPLQAKVLRFDVPFIPAMVGADGPTRGIHQ
jgi:hypothetical protein